MAHRSKGSWNPKEVLHYVDLDAYTISCVGNTLTGSRCRNPVAGHNLRWAKSIWNRLPEAAEKGDDELFERLTEVAARVLCQRNHQDQTDEVANRWFKTIDSYLKEQDTRQSTAMKKTCKLEPNPHAGHEHQSHDNAADRPTNPNVKTEVDEAARAREEDVRRHMEDICRRGEDMCRRMEDICRRKEDVCQREGDISQREEDVCQREEDISQCEEDISQREEDISQREEVISQREEDINQREEDINQREEDINRREEVINQREEDISQREEDISQREEDINQREEDINRREEDISQREEELHRREQLRLDEEAGRARRKTAKWRVEEERVRSEKEAREQADRERREKQDEKQQRRTRAQAAKERAKREQAGWQASWDRYNKDWANLDSMSVAEFDEEVRDTIPWPVQSGTWRDVKEPDVRAFFLNSPDDLREDPKAFRKFMLRCVRRWHTESLLRKFSRAKDSLDIMDKVELIHQVINSLLSEERCSDFPVLS